MQAIETLSALFDQKILAILAVLVNDSTGGLYLREISKYSKISDATTYRIIKKLVNLNFVKQQNIKKLKLYTFKHNEKTSFLYKMLKKDIQVLEVFVKEVKALEGVEAILLHGQESNQRANLLLIGTTIDTQKIKEICNNIREKFNFIISPLILAREQFEQMSNMGLYSGKERILFKR